MRLLWRSVQECQRLHQERRLGTLGLLRYLARNHDEKVIVLTIIVGNWWDDSEGYSRSVSPVLNPT